MISCTRISTSVRCSPPRALYFCVLPCGASPTGLCAVRAYKGFVLRCTVRAPRALCGASLQRLYTVCARACASGTVRASRALCGASLQRLCASVYRTSAESFARCEPTKALCLCVLYEPHELCAVRAYKGFIRCALYEPHELCAVRAYEGFIQCAGVRPPSFAPSAYVPVRSYEQMMSSCTRTCTYALVRMYCTSSHVICGSVREPICLYVAERSIHVELVRLRVFCEHPQSRTI